MSPYKKKLKSTRKSKDHLTDTGEKNICENGENFYETQNNKKLKFLVENVLANTLLSF